MNKQKKIIIAIISFAIVLLITFITLIVISNHQQENSTFRIDGFELPKNKELLQDKKINNLTIKDTSILTREEISTFKAKIENNTNNDISIKSLSIIFYENENSIKVEVFKDTTIKPQENKNINIVSEKNLTNITKIDYIIE